MTLLIQTIEELREVVTISGSFEMSLLNPHLRTAQLLLMRYVGPNLMARLVGKLEEPDELTQEESALLLFLQVPIANLALLKYVAVGNVDITTLGIMRNKTGDSSDAFEWQVQRLSTQLESDAWQGIEDVIDYLDTHTDDFPEYEAVDPTRIFRTASQFNGYLEINASRLVFHALRSVLSAGEAILRAVPAFRQLITSYQETTDPTEILNEKIDALRRSLAHLAMSRALRERSLELTPEGVQVRAVSSFAMLNRQPADEKLVKTTIDYHVEQATYWQNEVWRLLRTEATTPFRGRGVQGSAIVSF